MKILKIKLTLLATVILSGITATEVNAQVKVTNNNFGIGTSPSYKLHVNGKVKIEQGYTDFLIDNRGQGSKGGEPTLRPTRPDFGFLGTADKYFYKTYTNKIYRTNEYSLSDKRVKKNIVQLGSPLQKLSSIKGYVYELDENKHPFLSEKQSSAQKKPGAEKQIGFIAQELKEVFPEMVEFDEELGYFLIKNYEQMFPVLVEAINEQQKQIEAFTSQIKALGK